MKKLIPLTILAIAVISLFSFGSTVLAYSCGVDSTGKPIQTSVDFGCDNSTTSGIGQIILYAINFLAIGVVIAVVGGIAWGGLTYARSDGEPAVAKEGIEIIKNAIIALVLFMFLWSGFNFLVPGGALDISGTKTKPLAEVPKLPPGTPITLADPTNPTNPVTPVLPPPDLSGSGSTFTIASWNTLYSNSQSNVLSGVDNLTRYSQIIGFQELREPETRKAIKSKYMCKDCKFAGYMKDTTTDKVHSPPSLTIMWDKSRYTLNSAKYYMATAEVNPISPSCASLSGITAKWITSVKLRDTITGKLFYVLNTHTVAGVELDGKPRDGITPCVSVYKKHMDYLVTLLNQLKSENIPIFLTGDYNVNYRKDSVVRYKDFPYARLGAIGIKSFWQRTNLSGVASSKGSVGVSNRIVDYVWSLDRSDIASISATISSSAYGSDHYPVYSTVKMFSDNQPSSL